MIPGLALAIADDAEMLAVAAKEEQGVAKPGQLYS
jgi:hypothetical protein